MESLVDTGPISELLKLKTKIEQNISDLYEEREALRNKIRFMQDKKENARKEKGREFQRQYQLKIELVDSQKKVETLVKSINLIRETLKQSEASIWNNVGLTSYSEGVKNLRASIEGAINFYSEDSLRLELLKRTNAIREKRVELTRLLSECETRAKEIEMARREKERLKQLEIEREKEALERKRLQEEEKIQLEKQRQREEFLKQKYIPLETSVNATHTPFRAISFNSCSPEPEFRPSFHGTGISSLSGQDSESCSVTNFQAKTTAGLPTLSQFTRW